MPELDEGAEVHFDLSHEDDRTLVVKLRGELDISNVGDLQDEVDPEIERGAAKRLRIDAQGLRFADTSAIAMWVRWASLVDELELHRPPQLLRTVIESMGLAETLRLAP